jgi:ribonuclease BN (tRNA processing enzyme)
MNETIKNAIASNRQLRDEKDKQKKQLQTEPYTAYPEFKGVIIPSIVHLPSRVDQAMQWYFNGFLLSFGDGILIVDPGVDFYSRFTTTGFTIKDVRAIFVSHQHLDHCGDLTIFIDMAVKTKIKLDLIVPINVVDDILSSYYTKLVNEAENINLVVMDENNLQPNITLQLASVANLHPIRLFHSVAHTFGFSLTHDESRIVYISDTGYAKSVQTTEGPMSPVEVGADFKYIIEKYDSLEEATRNATMVICNINDLFYNRHSLTHLSGWDVKDMLASSMAEKLLLQHLSPYDVHGQNSNGLYAQFFEGEAYKCIVPSGSKQEEPF